MSDPRQFDPSAYPRSYAPSASSRAGIGLFAVALAAAGAWGAWYFATGYDAAGAGRVIVVAICAGVALLGLYFAYTAAGGLALVLTPDAIEVPGLLGNVRIDRQDIAGYRVVEAQGVKGLAIQLRSGKTVTISPMYSPDARFAAWFAGLQDLDEDESTTELRELQQDAALGADPGQRLVNLARARKISHLLTLVALAVMVWGLFYPRPYALVFAITAALPWIALWLCWKYGRLFTIEDPEPHMPRADLTALMIGPGIVLGLRALFDIHLLDPSSLIIPCVVVGLVMIALALYVAPDVRKKRGKLLWLSLFLVAYAAGAIPIANVVLDWSKGDRFRVAVKSKWETGGNAASQYFTVSPWGPYREDNAVEVPEALYRTTRVGDIVCLLHRPGAFGLEWYVVGRRSAC